MNQLKMLKDAAVLQRRAVKLGKEFEKKHGRKPTEEEAEVIAKELAADLIQKLGLNDEDDKKAQE